MSRQVSGGSPGDYQADEQAGVTRFSWPQSIRRAGRCREAQLAIIKQMSRQVSRGSAVDYQADEQAGVHVQLATVKQKSRQCCTAQLAYIKQMSTQVSRGSAGVYQSDEQAGVAWLSFRLSSR